MSLDVMNGTFLRPPDLDPERVQSRWSGMGPSDRREFLRAIGPRAAVREFGLPIIEVALAWRINLPIDARLEHLRMMARD